MSNILACVLYALGCFGYLAYLVNRSRVMIRVAYVILFFVCTVIDAFPAVVIKTVFSWLLVHFITCHFVLYHLDQYVTVSLLLLCIFVIQKS